MAFPFSYLLFKNGLPFSGHLVDLTLQGKVSGWILRQRVGHVTFGLTVFCREVRLYCRVSLTRFGRRVRQVVFRLLADVLEVGGSGGQALLPGSVQNRGHTPSSKLQSHLGQVSMMCPS
jgi:hypothetical protein